MTLEGPDAVPQWRLLSDEDFNASIVRGLLIRAAPADIIDVHRAGLAQTEDRIILDWAAHEERVLLTR